MNDQIKIALELLEIINESAARAQMTKSEHTRTDQAYRQLRGFIENIKVAPANPAPQG